MFTTYAQLDDGTGDNEALLSQVEILTGARLSYGYSTPIQYPDIVNTCGAQVAISCLPYSVQDYTPSAQIIGIEMCKQYNFIWSGIFPDDSRPFDLLYFLELIVSGQNTILPNRVDYCGRDLGGASLITPNQLQDILDNLQAKINGLDYTGDTIAFTLYIGNPGPVTPTQLATWRSVGGDPPSVTVTDDSVAHPIFDPSQGTITHVHGIYVERTIAAAIAIDQYVNDTFDYDTANSTVYYKTTFKKPPVLADPGSLYSYKNSAARWFFQALQVAAQQVISDTGVDVSSVYTYLRNARADYNNFQQQIIRPTLTTINQMGNGVIPVQNSGSDTLDAAGKTVSDAGLVARSQLLRDPVYVARFDTDASNGISATERVAMENDVNFQMKAARTAAAATISAQYTAQFDGFSSLPDDLAPIISLFTA